MHKIPVSFVFLKVDKYFCCFPLFVSYYEPKANWSWSCNSFDDKLSDYDKHDHMLSPCTKVAHARFSHRHIEIMITARLDLNYLWGSFAYDNWIYKRASAAYGYLLGIFRRVRYIIGNTTVYSSLAWNHYDWVIPLYLSSPRPYLQLVAANPFLLNRNQLSTTIDKMVSHFFTFIILKVYLLT